MQALRKVTLRLQHQLILINVPTVTKLPFKTRIPNTGDSLVRDMEALVSSACTPNQQTFITSCQLKFHQQPKPTQYYYYYYEQH